MAENNTVSVHCIYCGEKLTSVSEEYAYNNPNAFDILKEQESRAHKCRDEVIIRCNECGEVLGSCDPGYLEEWPNSSDIWIGQLHEQHQCLRDYTFDPDEINCLFGKRQLSRSLYKEAYSLHRNCEAPDHYACFHYMESLEEQETPISKRLAQKKEVVELRRVRKSRIAARK